MQNTTTFDELEKLIYSNDCNETTIMNKTISIQEKVNFIICMSIPLLQFSYCRKSMNLKLVINVA